MVAEEIIAHLNSKKLNEKLDALVSALNEVEGSLDFLRQQPTEQPERLTTLLNLKKSSYELLQACLPEIGSVSHLKILAGRDSPLCLDGLAGAEKLSGLADKAIKYQALTTVACSGKNLTVARKAVDYLGQIPDLEARLHFLMVAAQYGKTGMPNEAGYVQRGAAVKAVEEMARLTDLDKKLGGFCYAAQHGQREAKADAQRRIGSLVNQASKLSSRDDQIKVYFAGVRFGRPAAARKALNYTAQLQDAELRNHVLADVLSYAAVRPEIHQAAVKILKGLDQPSREKLCPAVASLPYKNELTLYAHNYLHGPEVLGQKLRNSLL